MRQDNRMFECNRAAFYRGLNGDTNNEFNLDKNVNLGFWENIWKKTLKEDQFINKLSSQMNPGIYEAEFSEPKIKQMIENNIQQAQNWKSAGRDQVFNFYIKHIKALHQKLYNVIYEAVCHPELIEDEFYIGRTYLIPKCDQITTPD